MQGSNDWDSFSSKGLSVKEEDSIANAASNGCFIDCRILKQPSKIFKPQQDNLSFVHRLIYTHERMCNEGGHDPALLERIKSLIENER